jgi:MerR family transcriptional regulator, copper efflux regulator
MKKFTIGQLAQKGGVKHDTIRYYERQGLLPTPARTESGYRMFSEDAELRILFIKQAQRLGFSLKEIKGLLGLRLDGSMSCGEVRRRTQEKIADVEDKIKALQAIRKALFHLNSACSGQGPTSDCPILAGIGKLKAERR